MSVLLACEYVHHMHAWAPQRSEEVLGSPRTIATDWILRIKLGSSGIEASVSNHEAISQASALVTLRSK